MGPNPSESHKWPRDLRGASAGGPLPLLVVASSQGAPDSAWRTFYSRLDVRTVDDLKRQLRGKSNAELLALGLALGDVKRLQKRVNDEL